MAELHNFCVLLVEDDAADAHLTRMAFEEGRLLVDLQHALDGVDAFDYLHQQGRHSQAPRPDLILLDLNMPRMDGRSFLERIKQDEDFRQIPVVVLTTSEAESDILASYNLGAAGFIVKPVEIDLFIRQVQQLKDYWISLVRLPANR
ncbi:response regulator [Marinospirillum alkaliphilum]|uniref:Response regulator receiver domain-containing protein n=1 Tax=Marinospirillum alkaliphilum DSM 21637 TaxID=1122209 RepID=A0A1K1X454_9GAMM|nr:response regulator [Marinospirillum alkaliphilum]SFX43845.1 Response regulator receiver domain-containing protein [Marinospirillum alkaliphilum DSM 21637]